MRSRWRFSSCRLVGGGVMIGGFEEADDEDVGNGATHYTVLHCHRQSTRSKFMFLEGLSTDTRSRCDKVNDEYCIVSIDHHSLSRK